jgi:hypothetical protein
LTAAGKPDHHVFPIRLKETETMFAKISPIDFEGARGMELTTSVLRLVAISGYGPRIAYFGGASSDNLLYWAPGIHRRQDWDLRGGHRVWVTRPLGDECEETYRPDNEPATLETFEDGFTLTGAIDPSNLTRRGFRIRALKDDLLEVDNFVTNCGGMLYSGGVWALTCTRPQAGTRYGIPLGDGSSWDVFSLISFRTWAGHDGGFNDPQVRVGEEVLTIEPRGQENKRMLQAQRGIVVMSDPARNLTFAKKTGYQPGAVYPSGANMAFYIGPDNFMIELETMGAEIPLKPGDSAHNVELWTLKTGVLDLDKAAPLVSLF